MKRAEKTIRMDYFKFHRLSREGKLKPGEYDIRLDVSKVEKHRKDPMYPLAALYGALHREAKRGKKGVKGD